MVFIILWLVIQAILCIVSYRKIFQSKDVFQFIYPLTFLIGAFVWEDAFIFSLLNIIFSIITLITQDIRVAILLFLVFWVVRSAGEALYFFLEQFIQPTFQPHYIHDHFAILRNIFGEISDQKGFIIMQITVQSILVLSIVALISFLKNWNSFPRFF